MDESDNIWETRKPQEFEYGKAYAFQINGAVGIFKAGARGAFGNYAVLDGKLESVTIGQRRTQMGITECMCKTETGKWVVLEKGKHLVSLYAEFMDGTECPDGTKLQENQYKTSKADTPIGGKWGREAKLKQGIKIV